MENTGKNKYRAAPLPSNWEKTTKRVLIGISAGWIIVICSSLALSWFSLHQALMTVAESETSLSFDKDIVYRRWAAMHGGVYVPPTEKTPPNPYLSHLPDRDVVTTDGKRLTLVNPAYMTRQVHELGQEQYGFRGHITSLNPLRPENKPDAWEAEALKAFEKGESRVMSVEVLDGNPYLRYMKPIMTDTGCLKCHEHQGYREGDIRGGVSISAPLSTYVTAAAGQRKHLVLAHAAVGFLGLIGLWMSGRIFYRSERKAREREEQFRSLFMEAPVSIIIHDSGTGDIVDANPSAWTAYGCSSLEELKTNDLWADPPYSFKEALNLIQKADREGPQRFKWLSRKKSGEQFWEDVHLGPLLVNGIKRIMAVSINITEQRRAEEELLKSAKDWQATFDASNDAIWILNRDHRIVRSNRVVKKLFDLSPDDLLGKHCWTIVHDTEKPIPDCPVLRVKKSLLRETMELSFKDGWIEVTVDPIVNENGDYVGAVHIIRDITDHKKAGLEKEKLQAQLIQSQKMESVGRLAGGVAHDFNNMLGVILGHGELALEKIDADDPLREDLSEIMTAAKRSADLTSQLLAFARKQTIAPKVLDLNETVEGMLKMLRRLIGEDLDLAWEPGAGLWPVMMDPSQVDQILANLCVNAKDAIDGVGKVTIKTENKNLDDAYGAGRPGFVPGDYVMLAVSDDGCGMDRNILDNLFEPFFTTKGAGEGTGLGLATVYGIVKQNGGFINVYSEPGQGATFKIYLPWHAGALQAVESVKTAEMPQGNGETLLVVEDEASILKLAGKMLTGLGYNVLTAPAPASALKLAGEHTGGIDLLMTDVVMPGMNGRDLAGQMKIHRPELKVLFMSGYTANVIAHRGILEEGLHFIQKPFSKRDLAVKVREALLE